MMSFDVAQFSSAIIFIFRISRTANTSSILKVLSELFTECLHMPLKKITGVLSRSILGATKPGTTRIDMTYLGLTFLGFACVSMTCGSAHAASMDKLLSYELETLLRIPVTSATLTEHSQKTVPSSVTVFTQEQIDRIGLDYLHELVNFVPGFQSFRQEERAGNEYYHSSRGSRSSSASREILVLINGARINREFDNSLAIPTLPLALIEKVEFIRGPGSAIYGSNAFLGVIDITLRSNERSLTSSVGDNGQISNHLSWHQAIDDTHLNMLLGFDKSRGQDLSIENKTTNTLEDSSDPYRNIDLILSLEHKDHYLSLQHAEREQDEFYVIGATGNNVNQSDNRYTSAEYQLKHTWNTAFKSDVSLRSYKETYHPISRSPATGKASFKQVAEGVEFDMRNTLSIWDQHQVLFGVDLRHIDIDQVDFNTQNLGSDQLYPARTRDIFGSYFQDQWQASDDLAFTLGARWDKYSGTSSSLRPRAALTYQLNSEHSFKVLYGEAFREPTTNELYIENIFGLSQFEGNAGLKPESIQTLELVWRYERARHALTLTLYENQVHDTIVRDNLRTPSRFFNASGSHSWQGLELELESRLTEQLSLNANLSMMKNLKKADAEQADRLASLILNYEHDQWNWNLSANYANARSFMSGNTPVSLDDYAVINSKLQFQASPKVKLYVQAKNLLDEDYLTPFESNDFTTGVPNRGSEWSVGAHITFD